MNKNAESCKKFSSVSIRKGRLQNVLSNTNEDEKVQQPILDIEALRTIGRIVGAIKERIEAGERSEPGNDPKAGGNSGSALPSGQDRGEDHYRKEEQNR